MAHTMISDIALSLLPKSLITLDLSETSVSDEGIKLLPKKLKIVCLSGCKKVTAVAVTQFISKEKIQVQSSISHAFRKSVILG